MLRKRNLPQNDANKYIDEEYRIDAETLKNKKNNRI